MSVKPITREEEERRFTSLVFSHPGQNRCWGWKGRYNRNGYGVFRRNILAHRYAYILWRGEIPSGLTLDHLCRNRGCVNPDHLEVVTQVENVMRGISPAAFNAKKTHCKRDHLFDEKNTYFFANGWRACRTCDREKKARIRIGES